MTTRERIYSKRKKTVPRIALGTSDASKKFVISCNAKFRMKVLGRAKHQG